MSRQGNSIMVAVPTGFLYQLNLLPGDHVELELEPTNLGFFVRPLRREGGRLVLPPSPGLPLEPSQ